MSQQAAARAEAALRDRLTHLAYLDEVLSAELDDREARRHERRIHEARLPRLKLIADFDLETVPTLDPALLGDRGTGKSHLLIGLGMAACQRGLRARYTSAAALVNELAEAAHERLLSRVVARYGRLDPLCLDEFGYVHLDPRGAKLLFQILTEREERASVAGGSNAGDHSGGALEDCERPPLSPTLTVLDSSEHRTGGYRARHHRPYRSY